MTASTSFPQSSDPVTVACCQIAPRVADPDYNMGLCTEAIRSAATQGAQVIILPELAQSGYVFEGPAEARSIAQTVDGVALKAWSALARELDVVIVAGFCEAAISGEIYNSAALIDTTGVRAVYRKAHLWDREKEIFFHWL